MLASCREYEALLNDYGVDADLIEPPMDFYMAEGAAHYYGEILVNEADLEFALLVIQGQESESQSRIQNEIKPEMKKQLLNAVCFVLGITLLSWALLPYSDRGGSEVFVTIVALGVGVIFWKRIQGTKRIP